MMRRVHPVIAALGLALTACNPTPPNTDLCKGRQAGDLVVTEAMLDPDSTDTGGEWIELFNTLGTPLELKGMAIYTHKGDGSALKTHSIRAGTIDGRGYFTLGDVRTGPNPPWINYSYADGLGALNQTDGVIGIRCGTLVLDEMSWTKAAKPGRSRMLDGTLDPDAVLNDTETQWCDTPAAQTYSGVNAGTPGARNPACPVEPTGGTCLDNGTARPVVQPNAGELVITEVMADPKAVADTAGEWLEVQAKANVDLNGLVMIAGASKSTFSANQCLRLGTGEYGLLAKNGDPATNGGLPAPLATFTVSLANSGGPVGLYLSDAGVIDVATLPQAVSGVAWQLSPGQLTATANDDPASFCVATMRWPVGGVTDAGDYGTPGAANSSCPTAPDPNSCVDSATGRLRAIVRAGQGDVVITEFMADPSAVADAQGEWFELLVKRAVDLNGLILGNEGTATVTLTSQPCLAVAAGSYVVFAHTADPALNGGLPDPAGTFGFGLANSGTRFISVKDFQGVELDRLSYTAATAGASTQLNAGLTDAGDNDVAANLCPTPAGTTYGGSADGGADGGAVLGDRGTPGAPNVPCP